MRNYILVLSALFLLSASNDDAQQVINNLKAFAKAYGYVKYFHPSSEAGNIDWNKFSALGANEIAKCRNQTELIRTLNQLFEPIAPGISFSSRTQEYDYSIITPTNKEGYLPTYWQHLGVSTDQMLYQYPNSSYKSSRVNQMRLINEADRYGMLFTSLDVEEYKAKELKYTGWVKLKPGSKGTGHLWMRINKSDGSQGFFANMDASPIKSTEWKQFEIIGTIEDFASKITFGSYLFGEGTLYFDDLKLHYKSNDEWVEIPNINKSFEPYLVGTINGQTELKTYGKGYSYHISNLEAKDGNNCAVIEYKGKFREEMSDTIFYASPGQDELIEKEIGEDIYCQIPLCLYVKDQSTYPKSNSLANLQSRLTSVDENPEILSVRLGNVINTYNVFQHFYPYFDEMDVDWDNELKTALKQSFIDQTSNDHLITLQKLTSPLKDGHIEVRGGDKLYDFMPSIFWQWVEGKLVITNIYDESLDVQIGDAVSKINGISTEEYFEEEYSRISSATKGHLNYRAQITSLLGEKNTKLSIEIDKRTISLIRDKSYEPYSFSEIAIQKNTYKELEDNIIYLNLDIINMDGINELLPKLEEARGIICDFRGYSYLVYYFLCNLTKEDIYAKPTTRMKKIIYPDQEKIIGYRDMGSATIEAKAPFLGTQKVVFITDGRAISAAEGFMQDIKTFNLATIVGQPTAGTNGMINPFRLLGNFTVYYTGVKVVNQDGSQLHGVGVIPDIYVEKTIEGIKSGRDEFLEKAIEVINK